MSTGFKIAAFVGMVVLCLGTLSPANAVDAHRQRKTKKTQAPQLPPLPSGPTGPVQQIPLDAIAPVPPQVNYENGRLTIVAPNSTLGDILRAVKKYTGAEIEIPTAPERVVTHLGPGPAREVVAELLNGSRFNYVLLGSASDTSALTRVVLVAKTGPDNIPNNPGQPQQQMNQATNMAPPPAEVAPDSTEQDASAEENPEENADQPLAEDVEQPVAPDQPGVKTPQQMLQEMQQRQLQMQQQQPPGQPPIPGTGLPPGMPPRPQQPEQQQE